MQQMIDHPSFTGTLIFFPHRQSPGANQGRIFLPMMFWPDKIPVDNAIYFAGSKEGMEGWWTEHQVVPRLVKDEVSPLWLG